MAPRHLQKTAAHRPVLLRGNEMGPGQELVLQKMPGLKPGATLEPKADPSGDFVDARKLLMTSLTPRSS
jgi:nitrous oxide reductase accessory protein NosL